MNAMKLRGVLITDANAGIGKEVARQLAFREGVERVYLACRNEARARAAKEELEANTDKLIFKSLLTDVSDIGNVRSAIRGLKVSLSNWQAPRYCQRSNPAPAFVQRAGAASNRLLNRIPAPIKTRMAAVNSKNQPQYCVGC
jgi:NAD(P)-dependent dehydrogenase (short-subunit alcohol dehydrogenase family)